MSDVIHTTAIVQSGGKIEITAPELAEGTQVKITIEQIAPPQTESIIDFFNRMPGHRSFKTAEEVDEFIRQERDAWDRE